jgi:hypothetical protein
MGDDGHGTWQPWSNFPEGDLKNAITTAWNQAQHHGGTHWAVQIHGTNPISGYRVRTPLTQAPDAPPSDG